MDAIPEHQELQAALQGTEESRPSYKTVLSFSIAFGIGICALALLAIWIFVTFFPSLHFGHIAGESLFKSARVVAIVFAALIWAPLFETLLGQILPIELIRSFARSSALCIFSSGATFSVGHWMGGGGEGQAVLTFVMGSAFGYLYVRYRQFGIGRSFVAAATAHCTHNAAILFFSYIVAPLIEK